MAIEIKTNLHSGIYKSSGGGQTVTHYAFATGPRNLLKAIETIYKHRTRMTRCYGNIGCVTWMEIDGTEVDQIDIEMVRQDDSWTLTAEERRWMTVKSPTAKAKELLANLAACQRQAHTQPKMEHAS